MPDEERAGVTDCISDEERAGVTDCISECLSTCSLGGIEASKKEVLKTWASRQGK